MFGISFYELLIILLVILFITRPKDIPFIIRSYRKYILKFTQFKRELLESFRNIHNDIVAPNEQGHSEDYHYVLDDKGCMQKAYNIAEETKNRKNTSE